MNGLGNENSIFTLSYQVKLSLPLLTNTHKGSAQLLSQTCVCFLCQMLDFPKLKERWKQLDLLWSSEGVHKTHSQPRTWRDLIFLLQDSYLRHEPLPEWVILNAIRVCTISSVMDIFRYTTVQKPPNDLSILNALHLPKKTRICMWASQNVSHSKF